MTAKPSASDARRKTDLAAIHAMAKELALSEDSYRDIIRRHAAGRTESAGEMTAPERNDVIRYLKGLGAGKKTRARTDGRQWQPAAAKKHARLIHALWGELGRLGALDTPTKPALNAFCARMAGTGDAATAPDFLTAAQATPVIEALKSWIARTGGGDGR